MKNVSNFVKKTASCYSWPSGVRELIRIAYIIACYAQSKKKPASTVLPAISFMVGRRHPTILSYKTHEIAN
jgi:hypothetical protein